MPALLCESSANSISLPSASSFTIKLLAQILCMGETEESGGLEVTMSNMKELQDVLVMLGLNIKLSPKLFSAKIGIEGDVIKEEVSEKTPEELEEHLQWVEMIKKQSNMRMISSGKFRQSRMLKGFKKNVMRNLTEENENVKESDNVFDAYCSDKRAQKRCLSVKLKKLELLQDFKGKKSMKLKKSVSKEECSICGGKFAKLRLHYRENHGIQVGVHGREVIKHSVNKCQKCGLEFRFKGSLSRHLRRAHNHDRKQENDPEKDLFYKCAECDEKFSNLRIMRRHSKDEHPKTIVEPSLQDNTLVSCQDCGLVLSNKNDMNQHCQEVHKRDSTDNVNMEVLHKSKSSKKSKCSVCDEMIPGSNLRRHIERYHEGRTYGCGECGLICSYKDSIQRHCSSKGHDKELI